MNITKYQINIINRLNEEKNIFSFLGYMNHFLKICTENLINMPSSPVKQLNFFHMFIFFANKWGHLLTMPLELNTKQIKSHSCEKNEISDMQKNATLKIQQQFAHCHGLLSFPN